MDGIRLYTTRNTLTAGEKIQGFIFKCGGMGVCITLKKICNALGLTMMLSLKKKGITFSGINILIFFFHQWACGRNI